MNKKLKNSIIAIGIILIVYLNYYKPEKGLGVIKNVIETTNVVYDTDGYHIEAGRQIDDMDLDTTKFERATAKYEDMTLSGNKAFIDAGKNLFLEENIVGDNGKGWKIFSNKLNYNQYKDLLVSNDGIKAINELENVILEGNELITNKKFDVINIKKQVKMSNDKFLIEGDNGVYQEKKKIFTLTGNGKFKNINPEENSFSGEFKNGKYYIDKNKIEIRNGFTGYYGKGVIQGKNLDYNNLKETFIANDNPVITIDGYIINSQKIQKIRPEREIDIIGKVNGTNGDIKFVGDNGIYKIDEKIIELNGNVEITNAKGEKIIGDSAIYNVESKIGYFTSKKDKVVYTYEDRKATSKNFVYNFDKEEMELKEGYIYEDKDYISIGQQMNYNNITKIGDIILGNVISKVNNNKIEAEKIIFDTQKKDYYTIGKVKATNKTNILKTDKLEYYTSKDRGAIPNDFTIENLEDKSIITSKNVEYIISKNEIQTDEVFNYETLTSTFTGKGLTYNLTSELGYILNEVKYVSKDTENIITGDTGEFKKDEFLKIKNNVKLLTEKEEFLTSEANYKLKEEVIKFDNNITFKTKDNKFNGLVENGILRNKEKIFTGNKFSGTSDKNEKITSNNLEYLMEEKILKLKGNVLVYNEESKLKGNEVIYNTQQNTIFATGNVSIDHQNNIKMLADNILSNTITRDISGEKISIKTATEEIKADKFSGNSDKLIFNFVDNVKGKIVTMDKGKKVVTDLSGKSLKTYFRLKSGKYEVQKIIGKKDTIISRDKQNIKSDDIEYDFIKGNIIARKNNKIYAETEKNKTLILGENISGNIKEEKLNLNSKTTIENIDNKGEKTILIGDRGILNNINQTLELIGNVKIENSQLIFNSDRAIYNRNTQKIKAYGKSNINYKTNK